MGSGDIVGLIGIGSPPAANRASPGVRVGGSTPAENVPIMSYDDTADEYWDFYCSMEGYGGGGLTIELPWMAASATTGNVIFDAAIRSLPDDAEDVDASHSYQFNSVTDAAPSASGELSYPTITFTDGADMDSAADGERFILRIRRDADNASDTMSGDAQLLWSQMVIRET